MRTPDCMFETAKEFICTKSMSNHWLMLGSKGSDNYRPKSFDLATDRQLFIDGDINLMVKCGQPIEDGYLLVLDVDEHEGQPSGLKTLSELEAKYGELPETLTIKTPSGGRHLWFKTKEPINRVGKIGASLEFYGKNYVMAPFSRKKEGGYEIIDKDAGISWIPEYVHAEIDKSFKPYFDATGVIDGLPTNVGDGDRTEALKVAAYRFRESGINDPTLFVELLDTYNQQCFNPPVSREKIEGFRGYLNYDISTIAEPLKPEVSTQKPHNNRETDSLEAELKQALSSAKGLVHDIAESILEGSIIKIDQFALASALSIVGGVAQGSYTLPNLKDNRRSGRTLSLYQWLHGASACGKNSYISAVSRYLDHVSEMIACDEPSSDYGLRIELYGFNSRVMVLDEIQDVLDSWAMPTNPANKVLKDMKMIMNDVGYLKGKTAKTGGLMRVNRPILSTFFAGTTEGFLRQLSGSNVGGGLMSRFVVWPMLVDSGYDVETSLHIKDTQIDALRDIFRRGLTIPDDYDEFKAKGEAKNFGTKGVTIPAHVPQCNPSKMALSPGGKQAYHDYFREKRKIYDSLRASGQSERDMSPGSIVARAPMFAYAYAGIHALGRDVTTIDVNDMEWAMGLMDILSKYLSNSITSFGGSDEIDMAANRMISNARRLFPDKPYLTRTDLMRCTVQKFQKRREIDHLATILILDGKLKLMNLHNQPLGVEILENENKNSQRARFVLV